MFSRGIFVLTLYVGASFAAIAIGQNTILSRTFNDTLIPSNSTTPQTFKVQVIKGLPAENGTRERILKATITNENSKEEHSQNGNTEKYESHHTIKNYNDEERKETQSGPLTTVDIDKEHLQMVNGTYTREGNSQFLDTKTNVTASRINDSIITGQKQIKRLKGNDITDAQLSKEQSSQTHLSGSFTREFHTQDSSIKRNKKIDQSTRDSTQEHIEVLEMKKKANNTNAEAQMITNFTDAEHVASTSSIVKTNVDSPDAQGAIDKHETLSKKTITSFKDEKLTLMHKTPLSQLLINDKDRIQTTDDQMRAATTTVKTIDDRRGTKVKETVDIDNKTAKHITKHFSQFTLEKTPTKGSASLPLRVMLSTDGIDSESFSMDKLITDTFTEETPHSKTTKDYDEHIINKYRFEKIPSCKTKNSETAATEITKENDEPSGNCESDDQSQPSKTLAQTIPQSIGESYLDEFLQIEIPKVEMNDTKVPQQEQVNKIIKDMSKEQSQPFEDNFSPLATHGDERSVTNETVPKLPVDGERKQDVPAMTQAADTEHGQVKDAKKTDTEEQVVQTTKIEQQDAQKTGVEQQNGQKTLEEQQVAQETGVKQQDGQKTLVEQQPAQETGVEQQVALKTETDANVVKVNDTDINRGTFLILLPRLKEDTGDALRKKLGQYEDLMYYVKEHELASKLLFATVGDVDSDTTYKFLYTLAREKSVNLVEVDLIGETFDLHKLSSQATIKAAESSEEESESPEENSEE